MVTPPVVSLKAAKAARAKPAAKITTPAPVAKEAAPAPVAKETAPVPQAVPTPKPVKKAIEAIKTAVAAVAPPAAEIPAQVKQAAETVKEIVEALPVPEIPSTLTEQVSEVMIKTDAIQGYEELTAIGKANVEALIEANAIFVKGVEDISKELFGFARLSLEHAAAATSAILGARSLKDVVELNSDFAKSQYEKLLANSTKLGEMTVKLATETAAPITSRANRMVETVVRPAA